VLERFSAELDSLGPRYLAQRSGERIALTRDGLLRVDVLLHRFFLPHHTGIRYT
jgi:oxygen-independent coproporphyrinogen-3 oxidase